MLMMFKPKQLLFLAVMCVSLGRLVDSSQQVISDMSKNFKSALDVCKAELSLTDAIDDDFKNFWLEDHTVTSRDTGCAFMCLSKKLELVDPELKLHHGNTYEWAMKHGADEELAKDLVNIIHECEPDDADSCIKVLKWANCYKAFIHKKGMAPSVEVAVAEILAEV